MVSGSLAAGLSDGLTYSQVADPTVEPGALAKFEVMDHKSGFRFANLNCTQC